MDRRIKIGIYSNGIDQQVIPDEQGSNRLSFG
jgi:hypothetical protein